MSKEKCECCQRYKEIYIAGMCKKCSDKLDKHIKKMKPEEKIKEILKEIMRKDGEHNLNDIRTAITLTQEKMQKEILKIIDELENKVKSYEVDYNKRDAQVEILKELKQKLKEK